MSDCLRVITDDGEGLQANVCGGADLYSTCAEGVRLAAERGKPVHFEFNGTPVTAHPDDDAAKVERRWHQRREADHHPSCEHGFARRVCPTCTRETIIAALRAEVARLTHDLDETRGLLVAVRAERDAYSAAYLAHARERDEALAEVARERTRAEALEGVVAAARAWLDAENAASVAAVAAREVTATNAAAAEARVTLARSLDAAGVATDSGKEGV